jgi:arylsulfatase A-like enzyme
MLTPNLDRLVKEGISFNNFFVNSPVCVSSRASLFTGKYPHQSGIFSNFHPWEPTWVQWLADIGYHCVNIGKMHINPYQAMGGFHHRFVVENKDRPLFLDEHSRAFYDEWDKALKSHNIVKPSRYTRLSEDPEGYKKALGAFVWDADEELHSDFFIGNNANWWLKERIAGSPLFCKLVFLDLTHLTTPSPRFLNMYKDANIPVPLVTESEISKQPKAQNVLRDNMMEFNFDSVNWQYLPKQEDLLRIRRHYAANISMIDEKVGEIISALESKGGLDNTIVIFTSDHADALGDHGHIQKWTMFDSVLRVPLIFWAPGMFPASRSIRVIQSNFLMLRQRYWISVE